MGQKASRTSDTVATVGKGQSSFKLFEYCCPLCKSKRPVQYFHKAGRFVPQNPRVVCGQCNTSVSVEPFKTVDWGCPTCKRWARARMPAKPIPLNMYNVSVVACNCGFKGEVSVGRLMDVACSQCWHRRRELCDVWIEDGQESRSYCDNCQDYQRCFAQFPKKKAGDQGEDKGTDLEYLCDGCQKVRPVHAEDLLRSEGVATCSLCSWVGHPEVHPRGYFEQRRKEEGKKGKVAKRPAEKRVQPEPLLLERPGSPAHPAASSSRASPSAAAAAAGDAPLAVVPGG